MLTILRNRVYLGEIYFRDTYYPAKRTPLVEQTTFDAAQAPLEEHGGALSQRVVTATDYLLAGRMVCARCGKHYVGAASHNHQRRRYRYYVCFSAHRYGKTTWGGGRCVSETERFDPPYGLVPSAGPAPPLRHAVRLTQQVTLPTTPWQKVRGHSSNS